MENICCDIFVLNPTEWEDEANYISVMNIKIWRYEIMKKMYYEVFVLNPTEWEDEANYISVINL